MSSSSNNNLQNGTALCENRKYNGDEYDSLRLTNKDQSNNVIQPLLTDLYQITMAYAYWKNQHNEHAVFDLFFRKNPFGGEFTIFAGLHECLKYLRDFKITQSGTVPFLPVFKWHIEEVEEAAIIICLFFLIRC